MRRGGCYPEDLAALDIGLAAITPAGGGSRSDAAAVWREDQRGEVGNGAGCREVGRNLPDGNTPLEHGQRPLTWSGTVVIGARRRM